MVQVWQMDQSGIDRLAIGDFVENEAEIRAVALSSDERTVVSGSDGGAFLSLHCRRCGAY